jgi:lipopolysaccharide export system protein LptC
MIYRGITTLIVIAVIVGAAMLGQQRFNRGAPAPNQVRTAEPGYSARDAELTETGGDGRPLYRLDADTITQHPQDDSVRLDKVRMTYRAENSSQWALTAEHGTVRENNEHIELAGNVRVVGVVPGTNGLAQILTDKLSFDARTEVASTHEPVTLVWSGRELHGKGLVASLKDRQVKLESAVHGRFTP